MNDNRFDENEDINKKELLESEENLDKKEEKIVEGGDEINKSENIEDKDEVKEELKEKIEEPKEEKKEENKKQERVKKDKKSSEDDNKPPREPGGKFNFKAILMLVFIVTVILSFSSFWSNRKDDEAKVIGYTEFVTDLTAGKFTKVSEKEGYIYGEGANKKEHFKARMLTNRLGEDTHLLSQIEAKNVKIESIPPERLPLILSLLISWFPMILLIGIWMFMLNRMNKGGGGGPQIFNVGKSKTKDGDSQSKVTFDDVAGIDEAKVELQEVVQFLREPEKFKSLGAKIPKGVLLLGEPGTGKTLLAKAVAGEAGVPFFSMSGSEFVEMFVGVGASRVRDLFAKARKNSPCIVFIDEIDAVGRKRTAGHSGGNDEREQTLNQLLVEMDGFGNEETIIVIAATNRPEILDRALVRPGRFDRQVVVDRPDLAGREAILKVHAKNKKFTEDVDLKRLAKKTAGLVGADLANVLNEAAILAARAGKDKIDMNDLEEATEKIMIGPEKRSRMGLHRQRLIVAYHEVGHALASRLVPTPSEVYKVTMIPRGMNALGYTLNVEDENKGLQFKKELISEMIISLGGRAAEEIIFGDITGGASSDIKRTTSIAHHMVKLIGMSEKFGPIMLDGTQEGDIMQRNLYGEATAKEVDDEIRSIISNAYKETKDLLNKHRDLLDKVTFILMTLETITGEELDKIIAGETLDRLKNEESLDEKLAEFKADVQKIRDEIA